MYLSMLPSGRRLKTWIAIWESYILIIAPQTKKFDLIHWWLGWVNHSIVGVSAVPINLYKKIFKSLVTYHFMWKWNLVSVNIKWIQQVCIVSGSVSPILFLLPFFAIREYPCATATIGIIILPIIIAIATDNIVS